MPPDHSDSGDQSALPHVVAGPRAEWATLPSHRTWLYQQAENIFSFFANSINPRGCFLDLDEDGKPLAGGPSRPDPALRRLHRTSRTVYSYALAHLLGRPGADMLVDHGVRFLWDRHRDAVHGGYFSSVGDNAPADTSKQAYGHAFVLLAASGAKVAGHPDAARLLSDVSTILSEHFWEDEYGAAAESFTAGWQPLELYRGQNANMHLTEALMAAFEATGDDNYLRMAERIADLLIRRHASQCGWRVPEHFTPHWQLDEGYSGNVVFRPSGLTPGHWLEWSRLLAQLGELGGNRLGWLRDAAKRLFLSAVKQGWDLAAGGFYYTVDWDGAPRMRQRFWWPCAEGISAAAFLNALENDLFYEEWYRRIWDFTATHFIDCEHGGWYPQLDERLQRANDPFFGKPDIYHSVQACLVPLFPATGSLLSSISRRCPYRESNKS